MWEAIGSVLTSRNAAPVLVSLVVLSVVVLVAARLGWVQVRTRHVKVGGGERERDIIRRQVEHAHIYIASLEGKIDSGKFGGFKTKYILERVFDEVVGWITFNHLSLDPVYIGIKQSEITSLVYTLGVGEVYRSPEFRERMCRWTREIIEQLIRIREVHE